MVLRFSNTYHFRLLLVGLDQLLHVALALDPAVLVAQMEGFGELLQMDLFIWIELAHAGNGVKLDRETFRPHSGWRRWLGLQARF